MLYESGGGLVRHPSNMNFYHTNRTSNEEEDQIKVGDIIKVVIYVNGMRQETIKQVLGIRHQHLFEVIMQETERGWRHWMEFKGLQEIREEKINQILQ
jgi:LPS sulfotransferase NodH